MSARRYGGAARGGAEPYGGRRRSGTYDLPSVTSPPSPFAPLLAPPEGDVWCALTRDELPIGAAYSWAVRPDCGAVVLFSGTVRDHAEHRHGVSFIEYEAYESQVVPRLEAIVVEARTRVASLGRMALLHRVGPILLGEASVVVVASAAHRGEAFEAARFGIDALKATVPIWKSEHWAGGVDWGLAATAITDVDALGSAAVPRGPLG